MRVLSLFDGISCGRVALERAGFNVSRYVAYEIDPNAIIVSNWNYPDIEHKGTVEGADFTEYRGFDLVIGGFPCTDLSIGKNNREGLAGKHSRLFWEQVRAIKEVQPRYFLVENNYRMPKKDEDIITETLGVKPVHINSALVSAQNRDRLYWTNIPQIERPEDRGVLLRDVLEKKVPIKYYHTDKGVAHAIRNQKNISFINHATQDKNKCVVAVYRKGTPYNVLAIPVLTKPSKGGFYILPATVQPAVTFYNVENGSLLYKGRKIPIRLPDGYYIIRRLTPVECERLQTLPDGYTEMVSDTARYNALGNGWTVDTIAHIFNHIHLDELL